MNRRIPNKSICIHCGKVQNTFDMCKILDQGLSGKGICIDCVNM